MPDLNRREFLRGSAVAGAAAVGSACGGSSPSSATISLHTINVLQRLKNYFGVLFPLHTSYTLFGWLPVAQD